MSQESQIFRIYFSELSETSQSLALDKSQSHWIHRVLRKKDGDIFEALNGRGICAQVELSGSECKVLSFVHKPRVLCRIDVYVAMVSLDKAKLIVEKLTELGVQSIVFVRSKRSHKTLHEEKHREKLRLKAVESIKQCGNPFLPLIGFRDNLLQLLNESESKAKKVFLNENEKRDRLSFLKLKSNEHIILSVGPEASWSESEKNTLIKHDFQSMSLGPNVLRVETAAIASVAQIIALCSY